MTTKTRIRDDVVIKSRDSGPTKVCHTYSICKKNYSKTKPLMTFKEKSSRIITLIPVLSDIIRYLNNIHPGENKWVHPCSFVSCRDNVVSTLLFT